MSSRRRVWFLHRRRVIVQDCAPLWGFQIRMKAGIERIKAKLTLGVAASSRANLRTA
jgi:hypothetical protein